jgi:hypothetical protein
VTSLLAKLRIYLVIAAEFKGAIAGLWSLMSGTAVVMALQALL